MYDINELRKSTWICEVRIKGIGMNMEENLQVGATEDQQESIN